MTDRDLPPTILTIQTESRFLDGFGTVVAAGKRSRLLITNEGKVMEAMSEKMQDCMESCTICSTVCSETINHCFTMGGSHLEPTHLRLLIDCAEISQTSANFMRRGSSMHFETCMVTARVSRACARACRAIEGDHMTRCAEICEECAAACEMILNDSASRSGTDSMHAEPMHAQ